MQAGGERQPIVLVAEPQALPGMWLEDVLTDAGCAVSGPYGTSGQAAASLDERTPHFAVVSVDLNEGSGFPLACALRQRGIPFALIAGNAEVPKAFADVPLFDRLFDASDMVSAIAARSATPRAPRACPMGRQFEAGEQPAVDRCPAACRALIPAPAE